MNYEELLEKLVKHPNDAMQNAFGRKVSANSYFLYEIHNMHHDFYESHIWIFNSIDEFVEFLIAIIFSDIALNCENEDFFQEFGELDYSERFSCYESLSKKDWNFNECKKFIAEYEGISELELIEFGKVSDLLDISQEDFDKCNNIYSTLKEIELQGLTQATYKIMNKFHTISDAKPSINQPLFFEMLENWES